MLDRAGFERVQRDSRLEHYVVFHDLRHTFASHWMRAVATFGLQRILGHTMLVTRVIRFPRSALLWSFNEVVI